MIAKLFAFIEEHRTMAMAVIVLFALANIVAISLYVAFAPGTARPVASPSALPSIMPAATPTPTATPAPTATPMPSPSPSIAPTVTPDLDMQRSITPLDQYAMNHMLQVDRSMTAGMLSVDMVRSDTGGQYAYRNDTYMTRLSMTNIANAPIDRIKIQVVCANSTGVNYTLYESERIDEVLLPPGERINRTVGFVVGPDAPPGKYLLSIKVLVDPYGNDSWSAPGCSFDTGLNILEAPK